MRNYLDYKELSNRTTRALQLCHEGIKKGKYLKQEYQLLNELAALYILKGDIREYPKVVAIYQYLHKLVDKAYTENDNHEKHEELDKNICLVEEELIERVTGKKVNKSYSITRLARVGEYKQRLEKFRGIERTVEYDSIKAKLNAIKDLGIVKGQEELDEGGLLKRSKAVEVIYKDIREFFIGKRYGSGKLTEKNGLINELLEECIEELGGIPLITKAGETRPCEYAIFGMGSMALGTMTPWSDIEFGILIEEGLIEAEEKKVKEYFRNLTTLLHIKVVNFGETPLRMMGIDELNNFKTGSSKDDWFYDDFIAPGFSFDGPHWHACKTPMGRVKGYCKTVKKENTEELVPCNQFELIGTVKEFKNFFKNSDWYKEDPQLIQSFVRVVLIEGSNQLIQDYHQELKEYHEPIKSLAFKILQEDSRELDPFKQVLSEEKEGHILKVKKEIYRFPDRMIAALRDCFSGEGTSWELIENLGRLGNIQRQNLRFALSIATEIRLRTYQNNGGQKENMSALSQYESQINELEGKKLFEDVFYLQDMRILFRYYYIVLEFSLKIQSVKGIQSLSQLGQMPISAEQTTLMKGYTYKRFLRYSDAINELEKLDLTNSGNYTAYILAKLYNHTGRCKEALSLHTKLSYKSTSKADLAASLSNKGNALHGLNKYAEALECKLKSLTIYRELHNKEVHVDIADLINNIASTYLAMGNYQRALQYHLESFQIRRKIYKMNHLDVVDSLNNIGTTLERMGRYVKSLRFHNKSLEVGYRIYDGDYRTIARSLYNIASAFRSFGNDKEALEYLLQSLEMRRQIYKGSHPEIAKTLDSIGFTYRKLKKYKEALAFHEESLSMMRNIYNNENTYVAASLNNVGSALEGLGRYQDALKFYNDSLSILQGIHKGNHPDIATTLSNIGNTLDSLGMFKKALKSHQDGLDMRERLFNGYHLDIAASLNNIGITLHHLKEYGPALKSKQDALEMRRRIYQKDHIDIATSLHTVGSTQYQLGMFNDAIKSYKDSLNIMQNIYKCDHQDIAKNLNMIGVSLDRLGKYEEALEYYHKSFTMLRKAYGENHEDIIGLVTNMQGILESLVPQNIEYGNIDQAIKYQEMLSDILPFDRDVKQNLGCYYHIRALSNKNVGSQEAFITSYNKALQSFEEAINIVSSAPVGSNLLVDYVQLLVRYHDKNNVNEYDKITRLLTKVIENTDDESGLSYNQLEKPTTAEPVQKLLDKEEEVEIKPRILAFCLLISAHLKHGEINKAQTLLKEFQEVSSREIESKKLAQYLFDYNSEEIEHLYLQEKAATRIQRSWRGYIKNRQLTDITQTMH